MLVAGMETVWTGPVTPPHGAPSRIERYDGTGAMLARGQEMGRFNTGSTVIVLFPRDRVTWSPDLRAGCGVRMGQGIGRARDCVRADAGRPSSAAEG